MKRKIAFAIVVVVAVFGGLAGIKTLQITTLIAASASMAQPPETVSSFVVRQEQWTEALPAVGSVTAVQGVTLTPEIAGKVSEIDFESGATVAKGDILLRQDTSAEEAQLRAIQAQQEWDAINLKRLRNLRAEDTVSQSELDQAEIAAKQSQANADNIKAVIDKKTIRAPFAGRLGIRLINLGEYLDTSKPVVSLQAIDSVYVDFSLPQQELSRLKTGMEVRVSTDSYTNRVFAGTLTAIKPDLDPVTRAVQLQATLENKDHALRPGMYAKIEVVLPSEQDVLVIPATSILSAPFGDSVYVIEPRPVGTNSTAAAGLEVRQQFVRTGRARGDFVSVETGLKAGERVVSSGIFKLRNLMPVVENNELTPKPAEAPRPNDS